MSNRVVDVQEAQMNLTEILSSLAAGTEIIITKDSAPIARLLPFISEQPRLAGLNEGAMRMSDDFDAPLPEEFWTGTS